VIVAGIVMVLLGKSEPGYLSAASGTLGEIIAGVFFYLYNQTVLRMGQYHQKLVLTQNIALALKIAESLPEVDRTKAQAALIDSLLKDINVHLNAPTTPEPAPR
jgi:hypothetical protein